VFWTWLHLLQFCVANQIGSVSEDAINKPWRPLPSGRISPPVARSLRYALPPFCLLLSFAHETISASILLIIATYLNNDLEFGEHWSSRNVMCAVGYWAFNHGAATIVSAGKPYFSRITIKHSSKTPSLYNCVTGILFQEFSLLLAIITQEPKPR
jgi:hypothetical protein